MASKTKLIAFIALLLLSFSFAKQQVFIDISTGHLGLYPNFNITVSVMTGVTEALGPVTLGVRAGVQKRSSVSAWLRGVVEYPFYEKDRGTAFAQLLFGPNFNSTTGVTLGVRAGLGYEYAPKDWGNVSIQSMLNLRYTLGGTTPFVYLTFGPRFYLDVLH